MQDKAIICRWKEQWNTKSFVHGSIQHMIQLLCLLFVQYVCVIYRCTTIGIYAIEASASIKLTFIWEVFIFSCCRNQVVFCIEHGDTTVLACYSNHAVNTVGRFVIYVKAKWWSFLTTCGFCMYPRSLIFGNALEIDFFCSIEKCWVGCVCGGCWAWKALGIREVSIKSNRWFIETHKHPHEHTHG